MSVSDPIGRYPDSVNKENGQFSEKSLSSQDKENPAADKVKAVAEDKLVFTTQGRGNIRNPNTGVSLSRASLLKPISNCLAVEVLGNQDINYNGKVSLDPIIPNYQEFASFNKKNVEEWVSLHEEQFQPVLRRLVEEIGRISYQTFLKCLKQSTESALPFLMESVSAKEEKDIYKKLVVLVENNKSNQWVAELAGKHLNFRPESYYRLGEKDARSFSSYLCNHATFFETKEFKGKVIVLFDDGSYSGKQITDHVMGIIKLMKNKIIEPAGICVIIPFMTAHAHERVMSMINQQKMGKKVFVSGYNEIPTIQSVLAKQDVDALNKLWFKGKVDEYGGIAARGLWWFDHKIPNGASFPEPFSKGTVARTDGVVIKKKIATIPEVRPPYKWQSHH